MTVERIARSGQIGHGKRRIGSDALLYYLEVHAFHIALGFEEGTLATLHCHPTGSSKSGPSLHGEFTR